MQAARMAARADANRTRPAALWRSGLEKPAIWLRRGHAAPEGSPAGCEN